MREAYTVNLSEHEQIIFEEAVERFGILTIAYYPFTENLIVITFSDADTWMEKSAPACSYLKERLPRFYYLAVDMDTFSLEENDDFRMDTVTVFRDSLWLGGV